MQRYPLGRTLLVALGLALAGPPVLADDDDDDSYRSSRSHRSSQGHGHSHGHSGSHDHARPHRSAELTVDNPRGDELHVYLDGRYLGEVDDGDSERFGVPEGRHTLLLRAEDGEVILVTEISLSGQRGVRVAAPLGMGTLLVDNRSGTTLALEVDGVVLATLRSGERRSLGLEEGRHKIRAIYTQLGSDRLLEAERIDLDDGELERIVLEPATVTQARVHNLGDRPLELVVNGVSVGSSVPGAGTKVEVPVGRSVFELRHQGRVVASAVASLGPYADHIVQLEPELLGALTVSNPLPIDVELVCARGSRTRVQAYGSTTYDGLAPGRFPLRVERLTGETIGSLSPLVEPGERERAVVQPPTEGVVVLRSDSPERLEVWVDGRRLARLDPREELRLSLPLGRQVLQLRDRYGVQVEVARVQVDPYSEARLRVDTPHRRPHEDHEHHYGVSYDSGHSSCTGSTSARRESEGAQVRAHVRVATR